MECCRCKVLLTNENWSLAHQKEGRKICNPCRVKEAQKYYWSHLEQKKHYDKHYRKVNGDFLNKKNRELTAQLRLTTLKHYSPNLKCLSCGFDNINGFTIEHLNGGGREHHRKLRGLAYYRWFVKNNFPIGFSVLCANCNALSYFKKIKEKNHSTTSYSIKERRYRQRTKEKIIRHYSPNLCCVNCKMSNIVGLTIDHIEGGGTKQRRDLGLRNTMDFYLWIIREKYPEGYQVLCYNCQLIKEKIKRQEFIVKSDKNVNL